MLTKTKPRKVSPRSQRYQPTTRKREDKSRLSIKHKIKLGAFAILGYNIFLFVALLTKAGGLLGSFVTYGTLHLVGIGGAAVWISTTSLASILFLLPPGTLFMLYQHLRTIRFRTERAPVRRSLISAPVVYQPRPPRLIVVKNEPPVSVPPPAKDDETIVRVKGALVQLGFRLEKINPLVSQMKSSRGEEILLREAIAELSRVAVEKCKTS